ncbi:dCTP deaminase domain-containing protein [Sphingomonas crusticola]|uniref:dCTP deaminase domain-containing protein n=1 Tax=Sphingomonas crusticola TaxID=1697973 RepID=UPI001F07793D|nr:deoxycytidine triphosphate deaminase [Sphingomonas crusticola]
MNTTGFWSGETLAARLPTLITPFDKDRIDCSAYTLSMGREIYVSPSDQAEDPESVTIRKLEDGDAFTIPPGQFAFLLTEEIVELPDDALGFISIKAKIKWRGLINVSGFHVDAGFKGRLIFAVYNAGPVPVHLRQGQPMFLLWLASLDRPTTLIRKNPVQLSFPADLIPGISGELQSIAGINKKIKEVDKDLTNRIHAVEREQTYYRIIALILMLFVGAMVTNWVREGGLRQLLAAPTIGQDQANKTIFAPDLNSNGAIPPNAVDPLTDPTDTGGGTE